jgi:hypothetical protein
MFPDPHCSPEDQGQEPRRGYVNLPSAVWLQVRSFGAVLTCWVEMDGDEMTRVIWDSIKKKVCFGLLDDPAAKPNTD